MRRAKLAVLPANTWTWSTRQRDAMLEKGFALAPKTGRAVPPQDSILVPISACGYGLLPIIVLVYSPTSNNVLCVC